eukprot:scaffold6820_cov216-Skeletonema_menzelii.AAC.1
MTFGTETGTESCIIPNLCELQVELGSVMIQSIPVHYIGSILEQRAKNFVTQLFVVTRAALMQRKVLRIVRRSSRIQGDLLTFLFGRQPFVYHFEPSLICRQHPYLLVAAAATTTTLSQTNSTDRGQVTIWQCAASTMIYGIYSDQFTFAAHHISANPCKDDDKVSKHQIEYVYTQGATLY